MGDQGTTFRKQLATELAAVVGARELDEHFVQMEYVEDKADVLGEIIDYYTDDLLRHQPFMDEFGPPELAALRNFILFLKNDGSRGAKTWPEVHLRAAELLKFLGPNE